MDYRYYERYINKRTTGRYDVTPIFENHRIFSNLLKDLIKPFEGIRIDKIAGIDALGFIIGGALANRLEAGFVPVRKGGKLPGIGGTVLRTSFVDYTKTKKYFEMNKGSIKNGERILIVDEWIETGAQIKAAIKLIEKQKGKVIGISVINAQKRAETTALFEKYNLKAIRVQEK
jgi:adenine phosphoribosyltransferase